MKYTTPALLAAAFAGTPALAGVPAPTIDGVVEGSYGAPVSVQTIQTQFGDDTGAGGGSELDAAFVQNDGTNLYMNFTGNLETNFNKLVVFFDSVPGGQNNIDPLNNPSNFDSQIGNGNANGWEALDDLTFDTGFEADYALLFRRGAGKFDFDYAIMNQTAIGADEFVDIFLGFDNGASFAPLTGLNSGSTFEVGHDASNVAGVAGGTQAADTAAAAAVTTGTEISIPLAALGNPANVDDVKVTALISSGSFDFFSNQFLAPLELEDFDEDPETPEERGNVGAFYDLSVLPGNQYFTLGGTVAVINGDYNDSGQVEQGDLDLVLQNWGVDTGTAGVPAGWTNDLPSGQIEQTELDGVLQNWGNTAAPDFSGSAVPEPTTLAVLGGLGLMGLRRRTA